MKSRERSVKVSQSSVYSVDRPTYPIRPYKTIVGATGRLVTSWPNAHKSGDREEWLHEAIKWSEKHKTGFCSCTHSRTEPSAIHAPLTASNHSMCVFPQIHSQSGAAAVGVGNVIPTLTRPVSLGWVSTQSPEEAPERDLWGDLSRVRYAAEADLTHGLSRPIDSSKYLRSVIELKDMPQTVGAWDSLVECAERQMRAGEISKSATVVEVARLYLTGVFGVAPTYSDARMWCEKNLKAPVKLLAKQPVEQGGVLRRAVTLDPDKGVRSLQEHVTTIPTINRSWSYTNGEIVDGAVDDHVLYSALSDWESTQLLLRPHQRRRFKGVFFGRVAKTKLVAALDELGPEAAFAWDRVINVRSKPIRELMLSYRPITTAWQVTPMSFLVDWFVNVGTCIRQFETYLANCNASVTFDEGVWLSIREEVVSSYPKVTLRCLPVNRLVGYSSASYTVNTTGTVDCKVEWVDRLLRMGYRRDLCEDILGPRDKVLPGLVFNQVLNPYQLGAGAALIVSKLPAYKRFLRWLYFTK